MSSLKTQRPSREREKLLKAVREDFVSTKRLNAVIERELYRRIKVRAAEEGRSISEITQMLWLEYLERAPK